MALARLGKDDWSLEVERDRQWPLDSDCNSDLDSVLDFDSGLNSARFRKGELALRKAAAARDREAEHGGDRTRDHRGFGRGFGRVGRVDPSRLCGSKERVGTSHQDRMTGEDW